MPTGTPPVESASAPTVARRRKSTLQHVWQTSVVECRFSGMRYSSPPCGKDRDSSEWMVNRCDGTVDVAGRRKHVTCDIPEETDSRDCERWPTRRVTSNIAAESVLGDERSVRRKVASSSLQNADPGATGVVLEPKLNEHRRHTVRNLHQASPRYNGGSIRETGWHGCRTGLAAVVLLPSHIVKTSTMTIALVAGGSGGRVFILIVPAS
jgi:hypothetical protein